MPTADQDDEPVEERVEVGDREPEPEAVAVAVNRVAVDVRTAELEPVEEEVSVESVE